MKSVGASRGFTLIEVLVAMVILAMMATMAWRGVDSMVRSRDIAQGHLTAALRVHTVVAQFEADMRAVIDTQVLPSALQFDGASLRLTRRSAGGVQLVVWALRAGVWQRWASPPVQRVEDLREAWLRSLQLMGGEPAQVRALPGVSQWQLQVFRTNGWTNAQSSGDVADAFMRGAARASGRNRALGVSPRELVPEGVRLILTLEPASGLTGTITREVQVAPQIIWQP